MAGVQPSQPLPSWLSFSSFVTVDATGNPTTEATIVTLPLTYFGPSIPLGTNGVWVFGGSTSPPPSQTTLASTVSATNTFSSSGTTSFVPSVSSSQTSGTISSSSVHSTSTASSSTNFAPSSSLGASPTLTGTASLSNTHRLNPRAIAAIVIVSVFVAVLVVVLAFLWLRRRHKPTHIQQRSQHSSPWSAFEAVDAEEGPDRDQLEPGTGDREQDRLVDDINELEMSETVPPYVTVPRLVPQIDMTSGPEINVGTAVAGGMALLPRVPTPLTTMSSLHGEQGVIENATNPSLFYPVGVSLTPLDGNNGESSGAALSPAPRRRASYLTLGNSSSPLLPPRTLNPDRLSSGIRNTVSSLTSSRSAMPSIAYPDSPVSDVDESSALMTARRVRVDDGDNNARHIGWGSGGLTRLSALAGFNRPSPVEHSYSDRFTTGYPRSRPSSVSDRSAGSGQSVYFDASSRPRSVEPPSSAHTFGRPLSYEGDILDLPVPPAIATVSSASTRPKHLAFPPGLSHRLSYSANDATLKSELSNVPDAHVPDDHLDEEPPRAGYEWGGLRAASSSESSSFGPSSDPQHYTQQSHGPFLQRGSLQSMRSHIGSFSPHGSGSRAMSYRTSGSSFGNQPPLRHSNSISSDGRRSMRRPGESESISNRMSVTLVQPYESSVLNASGLHTFDNGTLASTSSGGTGTRAGTSVTAATTMTDPATGIIMYFPSAVWDPAQGEAQWPDDAWTEFPGSGGARWWGPPRTLEIYRTQTGDPGFY